MNRRRLWGIFFFLCILGIIFGNLEEKHEKERDEVLIAFIDSQCSKQCEKHFVTKLWENMDEIPGNEIDDDGNGYIDDRNGWNFIQNDGVVFSEIEDKHCDYVLQSFVNTVEENNIERNYQIMLLNVLGAEGECSVKEVIQAIRYAEAKGVQICNLSLSSYKDQKELREVIENSKMLFVAAAGNEGADLDMGFPSYPTNYKLDNVISVAAIDEEGDLLELSNYGKHTVDVMMNGIVEYKNKRIEGTSIAAAKTSALLMDIYENTEQILKGKYLHTICELI